MTLTKTLKFDNDVLDTLRAITWNDDGTHGTLNGQLDRDLYARTNKALEAMGGKWNRSVKAHVFSTDPRPQVEGLLDNGSLTVERDGFFETPPAVVARMLELVGPVYPILEPSAGLGAIVDQIHWKLGIVCVEKNAQRVEALREKGYLVYHDDFLKYYPILTLPKTIYMNPPFEEGQDIDHIRHAYDVLAADGNMVSVISEGPFFRSDKKATEFREWLDVVDGYSEKLPEGAFKASGTMVNARLVVIRK